MKRIEFRKELKKSYIEICFTFLKESEPYEMFLIIPTIAIITDRSKFGLGRNISFAWAFYQIYFSYWKEIQNDFKINKQG